MRARIERAEIFVVHFSTCCATYSSAKLDVPMIAPRCLCPCVVTCTSVFLKIFFCLIHELWLYDVVVAFGKYPKAGPIAVRCYHHCSRVFKFHVVVASSANHTCLTSDCMFLSLWINGVTARAYIAMARGRPVLFPRWTQPFLHPLRIASQGHGMCYRARSI